MRLEKEGERKSPKGLELESSLDRRGQSQMERSKSASLSLPPSFLFLVFVSSFPSLSLPDIHNIPTNNDTHRETSKQV